jgi:sulfite exporter TauE/SafE
MLWTALALGFLGSFHCIGMCGPIALAVGGKGNTSYFQHKILYNLGRSFTYALLGLVVGSLGFSLSLAGFQQGFSILMGLVILIFSVRYKKADQFVRIPAFSGMVNWVKRILNRFLKAGGGGAYFATGLANGLLPCGMVYMALAAALGLQSPSLGAAYMFFFGLGTMPLLLVLMYSGKLISMAIRDRLQRAIPYLGAVIGIIFILRGLGLGIHGFSPKLQVFDYGSHQVEITMCE